jgi:hypothetical protein
VNTSKLSLEIAGVLVLLVVGGATFYFLCDGLAAKPSWGNAAEPGLPQTGVMEDWLENARALVRDKTARTPADLGACIGKIVLDYRGHYKCPARMIAAPTTLGKLAKDSYGDEKFWPLILAVNLDRFDADAANGETEVPAEYVVFVLLPARHGRVASEAELWATRSEDMFHLWDEWLHRYAEPGVPYSDKIHERMNEEARDAELGLMDSEVDTGTGGTLEMLSQRHYHDAKYWKLIRWYNQVPWLGATIDQDAGAATPLPAGLLIELPLLTGP